MTLLFTNNAVSTLVAGIGTGDTTLTVQSGIGALFPTPSGADSFRCTLADSSNNIEIIDVTDVTGDVFTMVRGQEGTVAKAYLAGDKVELRITKESLESFAQIVDTLMSATAAIKTAGSLTFNDDVQINFGTDADAELYGDNTQINWDINGGFNLKIRDGASGNAERFIFDVVNGFFTPLGGPPLDGESQVYVIANARYEPVMVPFVGAVMASALAVAPAGWLECDGAAVSRTTYSALFTAIASIYGDGDGSTTFNVPDLRGEFIRGFDNGAGNDLGANISVTGDNTISNAVITNLSSTTNMEVGMSISGTGIPAATLVLSIDSATQITLDTNSTSTNAGITFVLSNRADRGDGTSGDVVGSKQTGLVEAHQHAGYAGPSFERGGSRKAAVIPGYTSNNVGTIDNTSDAPSNKFTQSEGGNETRPRNVQMMYCIKF